MEGVVGAGAGKSSRDIYAGAQAVGYRRDHMEVRDQVTITR